MKFQNIFYICCLVFFGFTAKAEDGKGSWNLRQRVEKRESTRWTLEQWMQQKDKNKMQDLWLALNSPSPFEYALWGGGFDYTTKESSPVSENQYRSTIYGLSAFSERIGIEAEYEKNPDQKFTDTAGMLSFRLAGNSIQSTNIMLHYGLRTRLLDPAVVGGESTRLNQTFFQADLQLYLMRYFGVTGGYRSYQPFKSDSLGEVMGIKTEAGVFLDLQFFRVFGLMYTENQNYNLNSNINETSRSGVVSGIKLFF